MRWRDLRQSTNIDDRRGLGRGVALGGGGLATIVLALVIYMCGGDPTLLLQDPSQGPQPSGQGPTRQQTADDESRRFVGAILGNMEDTWQQVLPAQSRARYQDPGLVLFTGQVSSACGFATAASGPFYCPADRKIYLDLAFFDELRREFKAPGDFAQAYVVAHEFGHHIQNLTGVMARVQRQGRDNRLSVALELQADCYAGIWAHSAARQQRLEPGDIEEAMRAASAVGDDMIQKRTQGRVIPDSFTHGSAAQRMEYFNRGFRSGQMSACETVR